MLKAIIHVKVIDIGKPLKSRHWPQVSTATAGTKNTQKAFVSPSQNKVEKEEEKNKKKIAKLFALHVNAKSLSSLHFLKKVRSIAKHVHEE